MAFPQERLIAGNGNFMAPQKDKEKGEKMDAPNFRSWEVDG